VSAYARTDAEVDSVSTPQIRLLVADDQALFRRALVELLDRDPRLKVVAHVGDGLIAVQRAIELRPDVVLMDIRMPNLDGVEATRRILAAVPTIRILMLTAFETDRHVLQALQAGANAYILKDAEPEALISSIIAVHAGQRVVTGAAANRVVDMLTNSGPTRAYYDNLTPREIEILTLLASGLANKQIAHRIKISDKTVRNHISNIYEKVKVVDRSQAVLYAVRKGLVEL
jgi:two-component system, NarL family, response regulator LiaR